MTPPSTLRRVAVGVVFLASVSLCRAEHSSKWVDTYGKLLAKYVTPAGVRYAAWKRDARDMEAIQEVVDSIAQEKVSKMGKNDQLAFYINAYNAWMLHEALAKYPTKSVKDLLFTFFTSDRIKVAGEQMSFNHLEKDVIRLKFNEPRVHFALNCASVSCPPLYDQPFRGSKLDEQLEKLALAFIHSPKGVNYMPAKESATLSAIFDWYKDDFTAADGPMVFINLRRNPPLPDDTNITYQKYDWSLNEAK
ncbi:MAG: DUF547 domain-containing protein [Chthoniobacterales bacterium]